MHYQIPRKNKWYVVDISVLSKPELFRDTFNSESKADDVIIKYFDFDFFNYKSISFEEIKLHNLKFKNWGKDQKCYIGINKYEYPVNRDTFQKRKSFRNLKRRHNKNKSKL